MFYDLFKCHIFVIIYLYERVIIIIIFKDDILERLKKSGFSTYALRQQKLISNSTLTNIRKNKTIDTKTIDVICSILKCQPNSIMQWVEDKENVFSLEKNTRG